MKCAGAIEIAATRLLADDFAFGMSGSVSVTTPEQGMLGSTACAFGRAPGAIGYFFAGAFLVNAIPHFVSGVTGRPFQSPFASPPGQGLSPAWVNVLWGSTNLVFAYLLLARVGTFEVRCWRHILVAGAGGLAMALMLSFAFGRYYGGL